MSTDLASTIPPWVDRSCLTQIAAHGYGRPIPPGQAPALREAAAEHQLALRPGEAARRREVILGLRSATLLVNESAEEAEATVKLLRVHLDDVPADILEAACRAYCNAPGRRFFPKSAGELRTFINPLIRQRQSLAYNLRRLAEQAEAEDAERERLDADPITPDAIAAIKAEFGLDKPAVGPERSRARSAAIRGTPTIDDYRELGLTDEEARAAMAEHARILARARLPIASTVADVIESCEDAIAAE